MRRTEVAPSPEDPPRRVSTRRLHKAGISHDTMDRIYAWLFVVPGFFAVAFALIACFVFVHNPVMSKPIRLAFTLQASVIFQSVVPLILVSFVVCSLIEVAFSATPRKYAPPLVFYYILAQIMILFLVVGVWQWGPVQLQLSGNPRAPPPVWYVSALLVGMAPTVIFFGTIKFSRALWKREHLKVRGSHSTSLCLHLLTTTSSSLPCYACVQEGMRLYLVQITPTLGKLGLVMLAICFIQVMHHPSTATHALLRSRPPKQHGDPRLLPRTTAPAPAVPARHCR